MLPTALLVLAAAAVSAAPATDPPPKWDRPIPSTPTNEIPGGSMFSGWEQVRWANTNQCLTAPDELYEGASIFLSKCTGANNQLWSGRQSNQYDAGLGLYQGKPWRNPEWWVAGDLKSGVPARLMRYDPLAFVPLWSTPPTHQGRFEVTQYKDGGPKRYYMGYCLEVPQGQADCPPIMMAKCNRGKRQRWKNFGKNIPSQLAPPGEEGFDEL